MSHPLAELLKPDGCRAPPRSSYIPAAVRNTRRSIGQAPYLPLPSSPQPPELHHFR
jgi:hypothetical protein